MTVLSRQIPYNSDQHRKILSSLRQRIRAAEKVQNTRLEVWEQKEQAFVGYTVPTDEDTIRKTDRENGLPDYTTIVLPYSYAVVMAAHSYWTSVFLSRVPVWQFMGNNDEGEIQTTALESLVHYQMHMGRMLAPMYIWLQDAPKYGEGWVYNYWREDKARVSQIIEQPKLFMGSIDTGKTKKVRKINEIMKYQGNSLLNIHPSKIFTDPRYPRRRFQDGEFVAIATEISKNHILKNGDQYINVDRFLTLRTNRNNTGGEVVFDDPAPEELTRPVTDNWIPSTQDTVGSDVFDVFEVIVEISPKDWGFGNQTYPEKWVFTVDNKFEVLLEARPLGYLHNKFPLALLEIEMDGYSAFNRGLMEVFNPIQDTVDWLVNSHFFNVRQTLNNQFLFDPSRINQADLSGNDPGMLVRLKPAAYGSDVRTALTQIPVADVTQSHLNDIGMMYQMGERLGINDDVAGISHPSSRRSATEFRGNGTFGISRLRTTSEYFSCTGFADLGDMLIQTSQQFYDGEKKLRIAGQAAIAAGQEFIQVTPEMIAGQFSYEPVDGSLPIDRFAQVNMWRELMGQVMQIPQVAQQYDLGKIFAHVAQLAGIRSLNRFKIQVQPDAQVEGAAQQGNLVPIPKGQQLTPGGPGKNPLEPGQISGMGPTA